uniref:Uncharacterized protein n=1 Tax=Helianthus annuus TaxID=4232 RepID=A0A251S0Z1_HELAN
MKTILLVDNNDNNKVEFCVAGVKDNDYEEELLDYDDEEKAPESVNGKSGSETIKKRGLYSNSQSGFQDFLLKPKLLRAIVDSGFEHPSQGRRR